MGFWSIYGEHPHWAAMAKNILSIIIPVRNQPATLDELLTNLDAQPRPNGWEVEVIVVDNSSTDNTPEVIKRHDTTYLLETTLGPSVARNAGVAASRGDLLWFIDADAVPLADDFLVRIVSIANELGDFGGFGGPILLPEQQKNNPIAFADHMACWSVWGASRSDGVSDFQPTSFICRRDDFVAIGGFNIELRVLEDWDLQMRLQQSRELPDGSSKPESSLLFMQHLPVAHSARSSLLRTLKHSWYWGLPSRTGWFGRSGVSVARMEQPFVRWLVLPSLIWHRIKHPLKTGWQVSPVRAVISLPFLLLTLIVWGVAVIVGQGQPDDDDVAPV